MRNIKRPQLDRAQFFFAIGFALAAPLTILVIYLLLFGTSAQKDILTPVNVVTGEWPPFSGEKLPEKGAITEIVTLAFRNSGYEPNYDFKSWLLGEKIAVDNKTSLGAQATYPYIKSDHRSKVFYYSAPIADIEWSFFCNRDLCESEIESLEELASKGYRVLRIAGYEYPEFKPTMLWPVDKPAALDSVEALRKLTELGGKFLVFEATKVGNEILADSLVRYRKQITVIKLKHSRLMYLIASKSNPHNAKLVSDFNEGLTRIPNPKQYVDTATKRALKFMRAKRAVTLSPSNGEALIAARLKQNSLTKIAIPAGSRAVIVEWPDAFVNPQNILPEPENLIFEVELLNGPFKGESVLIDRTSIRLE